MRSGLFVSAMIPASEVMAAQNTNSPVQPNRGNSNPAISGASGSAAMLVRDEALVACPGVRWGPLP